MNALSSDFNFEAQIAKQKIPKLQVCKARFQNHIWINYFYKKTFSLRGDGVDGLEDLTHDNDRGSSNKVYTLHKALIKQ